MITTDEIAVRTEKFMSTLSDSSRAELEEKIRTIRYHEAVGVLSPDMYVGKRVLDWESGLGGFSAAFYCLGASSVTAIDSWVEPSSVPEDFRAVKEIQFRRTSVSDYRRQFENIGRRFDLIFSNTVTEHITNLPMALDDLSELLEEEGYYFNVHDNYYSPCGSHDHGFWFYGSGGGIEFQGASCWALADKCDASAGHREELLRRMPWTWNEALDARRNPANCGQCPYFKRSQPWAHLAFVDEFSEVFSDRSFLTWREGSSLNKVTTFQVRQLLDEAGFEVMQFYRNRCTNSPTPELLDAGFSELELTTTTTAWQCRKKHIR